MIAFASGIQEPALQGAVRGTAISSLTPSINIDANLTFQQGFGARIDQHMEAFPASQLGQILSTVQNGNIQLTEASKPVEAKAPAPAAAVETAAKAAPIVTASAPTTTAPSIGRKPPRGPSLG